MNLSKLGLLSSAREKGGRMAVSMKKEARMTEIRSSMRSKELWKMAIREINFFYQAT